MRKAINLFLIMVLCLSLVACGVSEENVAGEWSCLDDGSGYRIGLAMEEGTFVMSRYKQSDMTGTMNIQDGTYEIDGKEIVLHTSDGETLISKKMNGTPFLRQV